MSEKLISADRLIVMLESMQGVKTHVTIDNIIYNLKIAPAVDAVEVVRCKDCKYAMLLRKPEEKLIADCWIRKMNSDQEQFCMVSGDDFCSCGERIDDNE